MSDKPPKQQDEPYLTVYPHLAATPVKPMTATEKIERDWFVTSRDFPIDLLVRTAVAMKGQSTSDSQAADDALRLIDTCARLLERNREIVENRKAWEEYSIKTHGVKTDQDVPYVQAIKYITGQQRKDRAEEDYLTYLQTMFSPLADSEDVKAFIRRQIEYFEKGGIDPINLQLHRDGFAAMRDAGRLGKKRRPARKDLASKSYAEAASKAKRPASKKPKLAK